MPSMLDARVAVLIGWHALAGRQLRRAARHAGWQHCHAMHPQNYLAFNDMFDLDSKVSDHGFELTIAPIKYSVQDTRDGNALLVTGMRDGKSANRNAQDGKPPLVAIMKSQDTR